MVFVEIEVNYELCCHFVNEIITLEIYWILTDHLNKMFGIVLTHNWHDTDNMFLLH